MQLNLEDECAENLRELVGKKVIGIKFKAYNDDCWRVYINTDAGKVVMTFCRQWKCPVVEKRKDK